MIHIEQIRPELTWRLRQQVLYPDSKLYEMEMEEDNHGLHFGAFDENELIGVVSLFTKGDDYQFRKFAIIPSKQQQGIGRSLLNYIINFSKNGGAQRIWCNARDSAVGFYLKSGFEQTRVHFSKNGFNYEIVEKLL